MIKFNKFPPELPGDVELAESAPEVFSNPMTFKELISHGKSIGVTVLSSMKKPHSLLAEDIVEPLYGQLEKIVEDPESLAYFQHGIEEGIEVQAEVLELVV